MHQKRIGTCTILIVALALIALPPASAERETHVENSDGTISITIERMAQEQARAEVSYQDPNLGTVTYFDSNTGKPTTKENFQKTYEAQMDMVQDSNNRIVEEAHQAFKQGVISHEEFMSQHSIVKMANAGLEATRNQTVSTVRSLQPKPANQTADGRTASKIIIQKPRVLISN